MDGSDVLLLRVVGEVPEELQWEVAGFLTEPYAPELRERLRAATGAPPAEVAALHVELAERWGELLLRLLRAQGLSPGELFVVGSHGQTLWHQPPRGESRGFTFQIGDPATLAERVGAPVVSDFRSRDMAVGGEGAPLVPWADWVLFRRPGVGRALQNLGGMGNVTFLPRDGGAAGVLGFDTGPGVALLDGAARRASGGRLAWDSDGEGALRGRILPELLAELLSDPFFAQRPPRSTGRERFGEERLDAICARLGPLPPQGWDDLLATLTELTVLSIASAYREFLPKGGVDEVVLAGGGARNPAIVKGLRHHLAPLPVLTGPEVLGIDPDAREAAAFALLAWAHRLELPGNLPGVTGGSAPRVLGSLTPAPPGTPG